MGSEASAERVEVARAAATTVAQRLGHRRPLQLLRVGDNTVFRVDDIVLRVSPPGVDVAAHVAAARWLADRGVPALCPIGEPIAVDGVAVTVFDFIDGASPIDYRKLGAAVAALHRLEPSSVGANLSLPWFADASWLDLGANLDAATRSGVVSHDDIAVLQAAREELAGWQEAARRVEPVVCHGDVHPQNVLMRDDELVILDWDNICLGPVAWDHAALLTWSERWGGEPEDYDAFAAGYGADLRDAPLAQLLARVRLLAPTINKIILGSDSDLHAAEARVRMRYWRGEPSPPPWTAH
jgi:Ser/Thr protein kinase RdoA (MazF antagonist)